MSHHIIEPTAVTDGLRRIWNASLMVDEETTSRVMLMADPERGQGRHGVWDDGDVVLATWVAVDPSTHADVGMAMVSSPTSGSEGRPVLNVYVRHDHQQQGLGRRLVETAKAAFPDVCGYYTLDSVRLYAALGVPPAELVWTEAVETAWHRGDRDGARALHIQAVLDEREQYDRQMARQRPRARL